MSSPMPQPPLRSSCHALRPAVRAGACGLLLALGACAGTPHATHPVATAPAPDGKVLVAAAQRAGARSVAATPRADGGVQLDGTLEGRQFALAIPKHWNHQSMLFARGLDAQELFAPLIEVDRSERL